VTTEKIKVVIDSNRWGVPDFPKPQVTRVEHDLDMVPVLSTNTTKVMTRTILTWNYMDNERNMESNSRWISMEVRIRFASIRMQTVLGKFS
jgi:hypothetical protein